MFSLLKINILFSIFLGCILYTVYIIYKHTLASSVIESTLENNIKTNHTNPTKFYRIIPAPFSLSPSEGVFGLHGYLTPVCYQPIRTMHETTAALFSK